LIEKVVPGEHWVIYMWLENLRPQGGFQQIIKIALEIRFPSQYGQCFLKPRSPPSAMASALYCVPEHLMSKLLLIYGTSIIDSSDWARGDWKMNMWWGLMAS
jgi:hypothetical protein